MLGSLHRRLYNIKKLFGDKVECIKLHVDLYTELLLFDLTPKFFCIAGVSDGVKITHGIAVYGSNGLQHTKPSSSTYYANLTWQENGITWYANDAFLQFNESTIGTTIYYYIAIGK